MKKLLIAFLLLIPNYVFGFATTSVPLIATTTTSVYINRINGAQPGMVIVNSTTSAATSTSLYTSGQTILAGASGRVGVGTTSPSAPLAVQGNVYFGDSSGFLSLATNEGSNSTNYRIGRGAMTLNAGVYAGSNFNALLTNMTQMSSSGGVGLILNTTNATPIVFSTDNFIERMRIQPTTGNVGIGTTSPFAPFAISQNVNSSNQPGFILQNTSGGSSAASAFNLLNDAGIQGSFFLSGSNNNGIGLANQMAFTGQRGIVMMADSGVANGGANSFSVRTGGFNASNERLRITSSGNVGIGTTTPYANLSVQSGASTGDAFAVATSSGAAVFGIDNDGHRWSSGPSGAVSSCGTGSGTVAGDDQAGTITTATAATACTYTFSKAYRIAPVCTVTDNSLVGFADISSVSTTAITFGISSALTGGLLYYHCDYHQ